MKTHDHKLTPRFGLAYRAAHSEALKLARNGKGDPKQLKLAYLHDAFGLHYLSDQFAAGHTRCPRSEMNWPSLAGKSYVTLARYKLTVRRKNIGFCERNNRCSLLGCVGQNDKHHT